MWGHGRMYERTDEAKRQMDPIAKDPSLQPTKSKRYDRENTLLKSIHSFVAPPPITERVRVEGGAQGNHDHGPCTVCGAALHD